MSLHKSSDNTHEIYGRNNTRSFETDSKKDGFERVDQYYRDIYGRLIQTDTAIEGVGSNSTKYTPDLYGRNQVIELLQQNGTRTRKSVYDFDAYGRTTKSEFYDSSDRKTAGNEYQYDERGRSIYHYQDKNGTGVFDVGDRILENVYNPLGQIIERKDTWKNRDGSLGTEHRIYELDDFNRIHSVFFDLDGGKTFDANEKKNVYYYFGNTRVDSYIESFVGTTKVSTTKLVYPDVGEKGDRLMEIHAPNANEEFTLAKYGVYSFHFSSQDDYTNENWKNLFSQYGGKIEKLTLTNATTSTEITLDNDVIARLSNKVANGTLTINGDATDSVHLKDYAEFTYVGKQTGGKNQYDKLTTQVDGKDYTLLVDTDIHLFDADKGTEIL